MGRLRYSILALVIHLTFFFNIERLDINTRNPIDLDSVVYILTLIATTSILTVRWLNKLRREALIALWIGIFFIAKLSFLSRHPLFGDIYSYLSFTELGLLVIAAILSQNLAMNILDFENAIENFSFINVKKIKHIQEATDEIKSELYRSRRHQRPLSLIVIEQDPEEAQTSINKIVQDAQRSMAMQYISVMLGNKLSSLLRRTDMLFIANDKKLIILSPETDIFGANILIDRIRALTNQIGIFVHLGSAIFPEQALTFEQLLEEAEVSLPHKNADSS